MFAQGQLLSAFAAVAPAEARRLAAGRLPGVHRDIGDLTVYFDRFRGVSQRIGHAVNDRYLRANRVRGGTLEYQRSAHPLIMDARQHGGTVLPERGRGGPDSLMIASARATADVTYSIGGPGVRSALDRYHRFLICHRGLPPTLP